MTIIEPAIEDLQQLLIGYVLPEGRVRIEPYEAWLGDEAMLAGHHDGPLNPTWVLVVALRGMGLSIDDLVGLAGSRTADGVLFGGVEFEESVPMEVGSEYTVAGTIANITRRSGRSGTFDVLIFELSILSVEAEQQGVVRCSFILPRGRS